MGRSVPHIAHYGAARYLRQLLTTVPAGRCMLVADVVLTFGPFGCAEVVAEVIFVKFAVRG